MADFKNKISTRPMNIAVIGSGIAGLSAAWLLAKKHNITLYEQNNYPGGHSNTIDVKRGTLIENIDSGFVVYNSLNYPTLCDLFKYLNISGKPSEMSFSVSIKGGRLEYSSNGLNGFFSQRSNIFSPGHWSILIDLMKFYREARQCIDNLENNITVGNFLVEKSYSRSFIENHLLPMIGAIWSVPSHIALEFPIDSIINFFQNHGLLKLNNRPAWQTVVGGSKTYVNALIKDMPGPVHLKTKINCVIRDKNVVKLIDDTGGTHIFDAVIIATHADQALQILQTPTPDEIKILGQIPYCKNLAVLHSDTRLMPKRKKVWSSWNVMDQGLNSDKITVTYWMNRLHKIHNFPDMFVSLNPNIDPITSKIEKTFQYDHPILTTSALNAKSNLSILQGAKNIWYCGSYFGYGFHEDALKSGLSVAEQFGVLPPWKK